jgi:hypothetical protein
MVSCLPSGLGNGADRRYYVRVCSEPADFASHALANFVVRQFDRFGRGNNVRHGTWDAGTRLIQYGHRGTDLAGYNIHIKKRRVRQTLLHRVQLGAGGQSLDGCNPVLVMRDGEGHSRNKSSREDQVAYARDR